MKKFKENNPIDIIEALCQMGNTERAGKFEMPWSKDNSEQEAMLKHMFLPNDGKSQMQTFINEQQVFETDKSYPEIGMNFPSGFYVYSYEDTLPQLQNDYCIRLELCIDNGFGVTPNFYDVYLYYIGD